jgi:hypothetical protein
LAVGFYTELRSLEIKPIPGPYLLEDFGYYTRALSDALAGRDPYAIRSIGIGYLYPPPSLLVIELFAHISPFFLQVSTYAVFNLVLLSVMICGVARRYGYTLDTIWWWFPLAFGFAPFLELLHIGQINMITQFGVF